MEIIDNKKYDVVGLGLNAVDYLCVVPSYPSFNAKVRMLGFKKEAGGQIATALVALARWGLSTAYLGKVGDDEWGNFTRRKLEDEGVDTTHLITVKGIPSQFAFIMVDKQSGERTIVWFRDERVNLTPQDVDPNFVTAGKILHIDGHEEEAALYAAHIAKSKGIKVVLDIEISQDKTEELISLTDVLISDEKFPIDFTNQSGNMEALKALKALGPEMVVITLGKEGALALSAEGTIKSPGFKVKVVDTTGAGDIFHAGFIYGMLQKWDIRKTLAFANGAAALKCRKLGGRAGIPSLDEVAFLLKD